MTTIVLLLLGSGFVLLGFQGWRMRSAADPASSVQGFARVLAAMDPEGRPTSTDGPGSDAAQDAHDPAEASGDRS